MARDYLGWTQAELAYRAKVGQSAISQVENGGPIGLDTLKSICWATDYSMDFFTRGPLSDMPDLSLRYRSRASRPAKFANRFRAHCRHGIELVEDLWQRLDLPPVTIQPVVEKIDLEAIEKIALLTRRQLGIGIDDPVPNVIRAAERGGVFIFGSSIDAETIDAASVWSSLPTDRPLICFVRGRPGDRQRLSVAHELGHLILHKYRRVDNAIAEKEAFRFAAAMLIPEHAAREELKPPILLSRLVWKKAKWGVSVAALIRRAFDLRLIDDFRYRSLQKQLSARKWTKVEPGDVRPEEPILMAQTLRQAYRADDPSTISAHVGLSRLAARDLIA